LSSISKIADEVFEVDGSGFAASDLGEGGGGGGGLAGAADATTLSLGGLAGKERTGLFSIAAQGALEIPSKTLRPLGRVRLQLS